MPNRYFFVLELIDQVDDAVGRRDVGCDLCDLRADVAAEADQLDGGFFHRGPA